MRAGMMVEKATGLNEGQGPRGVAFEYVGGLAEPQVPQPLLDAANGRGTGQVDGIDGDDCDLFAEPGYIDFSDDEDEAELSVLGA